MDDCATHEVANTIAYEMKMFAHLFHRLRLESEESEAFIPGEIVLRGTGDSTESKRDSSAYLESFLLHARVLRDFLYYFQFKDSKNKPKYPDDVMAQHFVPDWDETLEEDTYLFRNKRRMDKSLAHLTTTRVKFNATEKHWDVARIFRELQPVIDRFRSLLPEDKKEWFDKDRLDQ